MTDSARTTSALPDVPRVGRRRAGRHALMSMERAIRQVSFTSFPRRRPTGSTAQSFFEGAFLEAEAVDQGDQQHRVRARSADPVARDQTAAGEDEQQAAIARMAQDSIGTAFHDDLIFARLNRRVSDGASRVSLLAGSCPVREPDRSEIVGAVGQQRGRDPLRRPGIPPSRLGRLGPCTGSEPPCAAARTAAGVARVDRKRRGGGEHRVDGRARHDAVPFARVRRGQGRTPTTRHGAG